MTLRRRWRLRDCSQRGPSGLTACRPEWPTWPRPAAAARALGGWIRAARRVLPELAYRLRRYFRPDPSAPRELIAEPLGPPGATRAFLIRSTDAASPASAADPRVQAIVDRAAVRAAELATPTVAALCAQGVTCRALLKADRPDAGADHVVVAAAPPCRQAAVHRLAYCLLEQERAHRSNA